MVPPVFSILAEQRSRKYTYGWSGQGAIAGEQRISHSPHHPHCGFHTRQARSIVRSEYVPFTRETCHIGWRCLGTPDSGRDTPCSPGTTRIKASFKGNPSGHVQIFELELLLKTLGFCQADDVTGINRRTERAHAYPRNRSHLSPKHSMDYAAWRRTNSSTVQP